VLLSVSALTGGARNAKPVRPEDTSEQEANGGCGACSGSCDVNANCELKRHAEVGGEEEEEEMDLADRPEPEGLNETDGHPGLFCSLTFNTVSPVRVL